MATKYSKLSFSELVEKEVLFRKAYRKCVLCPWECGVDRTKGDRGVCGAAASAKVATSTVHFGEEPMISGIRGSGTIFFSGCHMRCDFCQNYQISQGGSGSETMTRPSRA